MIRPRVIPVLLLKGQGLYKTIKFSKPTYVGDPINIVKIFNEKGIDELIVLDIDASKEKKAPNFQLLQDFASECFMPLCYGGGVATIEQMKRLFYDGVEKVALNSSAIENPELVEAAAKNFGSQSVVASIDVKKDLFGRAEVYSHTRNARIGENPVTFAKRMETLGAGEIFITSVDQEGTCKGYDLDLLKKVSEAVSVPVVAHGGAGTLDHLAQAIEVGASAVAAGSMFVFHGKHRAVLVNLPPEDEMNVKLIEAASQA